MDTSWYADKINSAMKNNFLFLIFILGLTGCLNLEDTNNATNTKKQPTYTSEYTNSTNTEVKDTLRNEEKFIIDYSGKTSIKSYQPFKYSNEPIRDASVVVYFDNNDIKVEMLEKDFIWVSNFKIIEVWIPKLVLNGTMYETAVSDASGRKLNLSLLLYNNEIKTLKIGNREYSNTSQKDTQYKDNFYIVQKEDNINLILKRYNEKNNTNITIEDLKSINPFLQSRPTLVLLPGEKLKFPN